MRRILFVFILFVVVIGTVVATYSSSPTGELMPSDEIVEPQIEPPTAFGRGYARDLDWHPDGDLLAVASTTGVWFLDADFNIIDRKLNIDENPLAIEWNPAGDLLAVLYDTGRLIVLNRDNFRREFDEHITEYTPIWKYKRVITWHPFKRQLSAASMFVDIDSKISSQPHIYDAYWGRSVDDPPLEQRQTGEMIWSPDGKHYIARESVAGCSPCTDHAIYEAQTGNFVHFAVKRLDSAQFLWIADYPVYAMDMLSTFEPVHNPNLNAIAFIQSYPFTNDPSVIEVLSLDGKEQSTEVVSRALPVWDLPNYSENSPQNYSDIPMRLDWTPTDDYLLTMLTESGSLVQIDVRTMEVVQTHPLFMPMNGVSLTWSPDMTHIALVSSGAYEFPTRIWQLDNPSYEPMKIFNQEVYAMPDYAKFGEPIHTAKVTWNKQDELIVAENTKYAGRYYHEVATWNPFTGEKIETLMEHSVFPERAVYQLGFFPKYTYSTDFSLMASYNMWERSTWLFDMTNMDTIRNNLSYSLTASISPNNQVIATDTAMWEIETGQKLYDLDETNLAWSPDGWLLASYRYDSMTIVETATGKLLETYDLTDIKHIYPYSVQWSPNGRYIMALLGSDYIPIVSMIDRLNPEIVISQASDFSSFVWSPDGSQLVVLTRQGTIEVRDANDYIKLFELPD